MKPAPRRPPAPKGMSTEARREWRRLVALLEPTGLLTRLDGDLLRRYCDNLVLRDTLYRQIMSEGPTVKGYRGSVVKHPAATMYAQVCSQLGRDGDRLGLAPAARVRMPVAEPDEDHDPITELLT